MREDECQKMSYLLATSRLFVIMDSTDQEASFFWGERDVVKKRFEEWNEKRECGSIHALLANEGKRKLWKSVAVLG